MNDITSAVVALAEKHLGEFRIRNGQIVARLCPFCGGGDNGDTDTFAIGMHNGAFSCLRGGCNKTGSFRDLCEYFGERPAVNVPKTVSPSKKTYEKPDASMLLPLSEEAVTYFAVRKISEDT